MTWGKLNQGEFAAPCPFCGESDVTMCVYPDEAFIQCQTCTSTGPNGATRESALIQWNEREVTSRASAQKEES